MYVCMYVWWSGLGESEMRNIYIDMICCRACGFYCGGADEWLWGFVDRVGSRTKTDVSRLLIEARDF